ncbi:response regulator [Lacipirellula limnantheis]|nr:response regulator [Lacipirellula limnantheis]
MRNQLNKVTLRLHLLQKQLQVGKVAEADRTLSEAIDVLGGLDREATPSDAIARPPLKESAPKFRVLVVEDDANERELLAGLLTMNGCECITAADGLAALEFLGAGVRPDFVLLDMRMPRCDGPQTLRRIRNSARFEKLRVFAISGTSPCDLSIDAGPRGVDAWFAKPLNPRSLWDAMEQHRSQVAAAN